MNNVSYSNSGDTKGAKRTNYLLHVQYSPEGKYKISDIIKEKNRQFADQMIVDKFYHFHHHRGITLNNYIFVQCTL
jgi:hypothetical protein